MALPTLTLSLTLTLTLTLSLALTQTLTVTLTLYTPIKTTKINITKQREWEMLMTLTQTLMTKPQQFNFYGIIHNIMYYYYFYYIPFLPSPFQLMPLNASQWTFKHLYSRTRSYITLFIPRSKVTNWLWVKAVKV